MADLGRVVVVAAGFALWQGGRCVAAARWSDIRRLHAYRRPGRGDDAVCVRVELKDGSLMELEDAAPGFDLFLDRATVTLTGLLPFAGWPQALDLTPSDGEGAVIFERTGY